jgi:cellulose synthase/poly-beta-1,6-N-acetylglucosamine synthase-like glycosyltransferase
MSGIQIIHQILIIIQIILMIYLGTATLYFFSFAFLSIFKGRTKELKGGSNNKICVFIPAYKEDEVIIHTAKDALLQNYPPHLFDVYVIADSFSPETLVKLQDEDINFFEVVFQKSTKAKSLNYALNHIEKSYDLAVVLDADNLMEKDFLMKINKAFGENIVAIQAHRVAKNINTDFALLDAISEEINNNVFRKGIRQVGFSASLIGSAMAFRYDVFKEVMSEINAVGGFDKQLELKLIKRRIKIHYLPDAYVYDEKIQNSEDFTTQRKRWLWAQFYYLRKDFFVSFWHFISKGNLDYFNKAFQFVQLPRILVLGMLIIINMISLILGPPILTILWAVLLLLNVLGFLFAVPAEFYNFRTYKALFSLPLGFLNMLIALLTMRKAKKDFLHTKHTVQNIENKDTNKKIES